MPERSRGRGCKNHGRGSSVPAERMAGGGGFTGGERGADGENERIDFHPSARALILEKSARAVLPLDPAVVPPPIPARPGQRSHALAGAEAPEPAVVPLHGPVVPVPGGKNFLWLKLKP